MFVVVSHPAEETGFAHAFGNATGEPFATEGEALEAAENLEAAAVAPGGWVPAEVKALPVS